MTYTIKQLADLAQISVRTLHHYDKIGLLNPSRIKANGYRLYEENELLKLQQIMFFKELDFPLIEIKKILSNPNFDQRKALSEHKKMIELKKERLILLTKTIDKTIKKINKEITMKDEELYKSFVRNGKKYADEAKSRWGNTEMYEESVKRVAKMSKNEMIKIQKDGDLLMKEIVQNMSKGPASIEIQKLISRHYNGLRAFYEPNLKMYRGLADMYVSDPRFISYYEKYAPGLAVFMQDAMYKYCDNNN